MSRAVRRTLIIAVLVLAGLQPARGARADHLELEVTVPADVAVGEILEVSAVVRSAESGARIPGAVLSAFREASIAGVTGRVELASAITDELGMATLRWQHRAGGEHTLIVTFSGPGDTELESTSLSIITVGTEPQVVRSEAGVEIPGLGAWVLIAVLVAVWGLIQFSLLGPMTVARAATRPTEAGTGNDERTTP